MQELQLRVHEAFRDDVYKDRVRILQDGESTFKEGRVYRLVVGDRTKLVEVRGNAAPPRKRRSLEMPGYILIDDAIRRDLGLPKVPNGEMATFRLRPASKLEFRQWLRESTDPRVRISAQIADEADAQAGRFNRQSVLLAVVGLVLVFKDEIIRGSLWLWARLSDIAASVSDLSG